MSKDLDARDGALEVIQRLRDNPKEKIRPEELNFKGVSLAGQDLKGLNLAGANFSESDLRDSQLRLATGYETAEWYGVDIRDINFSGAYRLRRLVVDENYLKKFRDVSRFNRVVYHLWSITSDCGRSLFRWCLWVIGIVLLFSVLYGFCGVDYGKYDNWIGPFYYSVVTITTLGYGDIVPATPVARMLSIAEVLIGYVMLGGLLSLFTNKMARRGE